MSDKNIHGTIGLDLDISQLTRGADAAEKRLKRIEAEANKVVNSLSNDAAKQAAAIAQYNKRIAEADSRLTQQMKESSRERQKAITHNTEVQRGRNIGARGANSAAAQESMANREELSRAGRLNLEAAKGYQRRLTLITNDGLKQRRMLMTQEMRQTERDASLIRRVIDRTVDAHPSVRGMVTDALSGNQMRRRRDSMIALGGYTPNEAVLEQLESKFTRPEARFLAMGGTRPHSLGGKDTEGAQARKDYEDTWKRLLSERDAADKERAKAEQDYMREEAAARKQLQREEAAEDKRVADAERQYMQEEAAAKKQLRRDEAAFERAEAQERSKYTKARVAYDKQQAKITSGIMRDARREEQKERREALKLEQKMERDFANERRRAFQSMAREARNEKRQIDRIINRSLSGPEDVQQQVAAALRGMGPAMQRRQALAGGATLQQAFLSNLTSAGISGQNASFLAMGGRRTPTFGGTPPRTPGGGGGGNILTRMLGMGGGGMAGGLVSSLAGGFGIGVGGYALARGVQGLTENAERATAYERQSLAAERLAGSQAKLNALLAEYEESSGGAVDASTALANVARLLATGYADSVPEVEKFVKATRGASIALGKPQDYVIQETQLAMSNTSFKRLDQIGLGIEEVQERIKKLRAENQGMTRETAFQVAVLDAMNEKYGQLADSAEGQATGIEKLRKEWGELGLAVGQAIEKPLGDMAQFIADQLDRAAELIDKAREVAEDKEAWRTENQIKGRRGPVVDPYFEVGLWGIQWRRRSEGAAFGGEPAHMADTHAAALALPPPTGSSTLNEERDAIKAQYFDKMAELERRTGEQRVQLIEQYESQRADIIRNYAKSVAREEEDFARSRARSLRDYERSIVDMMRDSAEREAEAQEDLDENIAEMREDANEKLADSEEKYLKDKEKREEDHRDKLLKAAGQLDAIAILEERKRWKKQNEEAEEAHEEQRAELEETLAEQIEDAREAHAEQLQEAREADAKRLEDMRRTRALQLADEDKDRAIRLTRQEEDHNDQLAEMDRQHALRLSQLATQAAAERLLLEDEFAKALNETGQFIEGMTEKMLARDKMIEDWFDGFIDMIEARLLVQSDPGRYTYDPATGPNIPLDYGSKLGYTPPPSYSASGTGVTRDGDFTRFGGGGNTITFQNGAIRVTTTEGFEERVADDVIERVIDYMEAL